MNGPAQLWADSWLVYTVAAAAVAMLLATVWLFRRRSRSGRQAGMICLFLSIALHAALILLVPLLPSPSGGSSTTDPTTQAEAGIDAVSFTTFDPDMSVDDASGDDSQSPVAPLPVSSLTDLIESQPKQESEPTPVDPEPETPKSVVQTVPNSIAATPPMLASDFIGDLESALDDLLENAVATAAQPPDTADPVPQTPAIEVPATAPPERVTRVTDEPTTAEPTSASPSPKATVPGSLASDFANRVGDAKQQALRRTGGDANTEAAVQAALKFLADAQRPDGAWDPRASGAGKERSPLGMSRNGAGMRAETALTGLALLTFVGAGQTHQKGEYADNAYRGLVYLIRHQKPDGSLAGGASLYAANYSHGMAALAMCETAAITQDPAAIESSTRAIKHTRAMQHPTTGGWRYTAGDPGDLSQLGWQAMVLDAGYRAGVPIDGRSVIGVQRFLKSVRRGQAGGLACYRPGESASRTMTAEALATRMMIGDHVRATEISEAQRYLLQQPPGVGPDNYYYWYYATLALHQLQDDAWNQWNEALKNRLLATQRSDGSWPSDTLWGGYGGTIYTTSMAALCLEVYYRHTVRAESDRIANRR